MRVAIVTESFPPDVNGVAHCALRTAEHLVRRGHEPLVIAPAGPQESVPGDEPCPVVRVPSLPLPGYPQVRVALPGRRTAATIAAHRAELVHLASPFILGVRGMAAATRQHIPAVAVYQTDLAGYARTYLSRGESTAWRRIRAVHTAADRTLAPSSASSATWRRTASRACTCGRAAWTPCASTRPTATRRCAVNSPRTVRSWWATSAASHRRSTWSCWPARAGCPG